ncbi:MAG TPA: hypothetical protein VMW04_01865 [Patescibacteria group bacterium]|nr:hypothetical protein [Patescibacteria group bacterium]
MKKVLPVFLFLVFLGMAGQTVLSQDFDTDIAGFGFNKGIAAQEVPQGEEAQISAEGLQVKIPPGGFNYPMTFEILQGENDFFQDGNLGNRQVIFNFAFRVRNHQNNRLVGKFPRPVSVSITLPENSSKVEVWEVELTRPPTISQSAKPFEQTGNSLKIQVDNAEVGWLIVIPGTASGEIQSQANETPETKQISLLPILGILLVGGVIFVLIKKGRF